ncbi:MAG: hypothetical protein QNK35_07620, partial [Bacteroides sp.]|nr:hypothetical protein [Bacteroides sp.]
MKDLKQFFNEMASGANTDVSIWIIALAVIAGSLLLYYLLSWLLVSLGKKNPNGTLDRAWRKFKSPSLVIVLLLDFILLKEFFNLGEKASESVGQFITVAII